jgi:hypothetical protein
MTDANGKVRTLKLGSDARAEVTVTVPAGGMTWAAFENPRGAR